MTDENTKEWFKSWRDAANILEKDTSAKVKCPECGIGYLQVKDELIKGCDKLDRYMICDNCGRWNVMTMVVPENYSNHKSDEAAE